MKLSFAIAALVALAACGKMSLSEIKSNGSQAGVYHSAKSPMEFAGCAANAYDLAMGLYDLAHVRPTPKGYDVFKATTPAFGGNAIWGVISVEQDGEGSRITGVANNTALYWAIGAA
jgi:hypothetical protein